MRLPWSPSDEIVLGTVSPHLPFNTFRLHRRDQDAHATIWGRTGSGKSKLLQSIFVQHLRLGRGVGLIEPHHDLSFDILSDLVARGYFRSPDAYDRLVYLDWGNGAYVPFNVLAGRGDPHTIALNTLEAMIRVWPELAEAPLFQTLFLSGLMVLIANRLPITSLYRLLSDAPFRERCLERVSDPLVHQAFAGFDRLGREQAQAAGSTLRRAFLLTFSPLARHTLGQPENRLDFRAIMDQGRAVIINLGNVSDHETRTLLGALLMVQIEQAALSRTDLAPSRRRPFTLLVDEWPSFAAQDDTIGAILSQTRKFKLRLYLAAQSLAQISSARLSGTLENCRLTVAFGLGRDSAETQARHIGAADPFAVKEAARTETQHGQYLSIAEQFESWTQELQGLPPRTAYVKLHDRPAVKIRTLGVSAAAADPHELNAVLAAYRRRYQRPPEEAERAYATASQAHDADPPEAHTTPPPPAYTRLFQAGSSSGDRSQREE